MFGGGSKTNTPQWNNNKTTEANDVFCENPPEDTISTIRFSNVENYQADPKFISCSSWDGTVKVWELNKSYSGFAAKFMGDHQFGDSVFGHCWSSDNSCIFGATSGNMVKMWDLNANSSSQVAAHDA